MQMNSASIKIEAKLEIVEIWQVHTAINISSRRYREAPFCIGILYCIFFSAAVV